MILFFVEHHVAPKRIHGKGGCQKDSQLDELEKNPLDTLDILIGYIVFFEKSSVYGAPNFLTPERSFGRKTATRTEF